MSSQETDKTRETEHPFIEVIHETEKAMEQESDANKSTHSTQEPPEFITPKKEPEVQPEQKRQEESSKEQEQHTTENNNTTGDNKNNNDNNINNNNNNNNPTNEENVLARSALKSQSGNNSITRRLSMHGEVLRVHVDPNPQVVEALPVSLDEKKQEEDKVAKVKSGVVANWLADIGAKGNNYRSLLLDLATHMLVRHPADPQQFLVDHFYSHELPYLQVIPNGRLFSEQQAEEHEMHHANNDKNSCLKHERSGAEIQVNATNNTNESVTIPDQTHTHNEQDKDFERSEKENETRSTQEEKDTECMSQKAIPGTHDKFGKCVTANANDNAKQTVQVQEMEHEAELVSDKNNNATTSTLQESKTTCLQVIDQLVQAIPAGSSRAVARRLAEMLLNLKPDDPEHYLWTKLESRVFSDEAAMGCAWASTLDDFPSISPGDHTQASLLREVPFDSAGYAIAANMISLLFTRKPDDPVNYLYYHYNGKVHTSAAQSLRSSSKHDATCDSMSSTSREVVDESDYFHDDDDDNNDNVTLDRNVNYECRTSKQYGNRMSFNKNNTNGSFCSERGNKEVNVAICKRAKNATWPESSHDVKCTHEQIYANSITRENDTRRNTTTSTSTTATLHRGGSFGSLADSLHHQIVEQQQKQQKHISEEEEEEEYCENYSSDLNKCNEALRRHKYMEEKEEEEEQTQMEREKQMCLESKQERERPITMCHSLNDVAHSRRFSFSPLDVQEHHQHSRNSQLLHNAAQRKCTNSHKTSISLPVVTRYLHSTNSNNNSNDGMYDSNTSQQKIIREFPYRSIDQRSSNVAKREKRTSVADKGNKAGTLKNNRNVSPPETADMKQQNANAKITSSMRKTPRESNSHSLPSSQNHVSFPSSSEEPFITNTNTSSTPVTNVDEMSLHSSAANPATLSRHVMINTHVSSLPNRESSSSSETSIHEITSSPITFAEPTFLTASQSTLKYCRENSSSSRRLSRKKALPKCAMFNHNKNAKMKGHDMIETNLTHCSSNNENNQNNHSKVNDSNNNNNNDNNDNDDNIDNNVDYRSKEFTLMKRRLEAQRVCLEFELNTLKATCAYRERILSIEDNEANQLSVNNARQMCVETEQHLHYLQTQVDKLNKLILMEPSSEMLTHATTLDKAKINMPTEMLQEQPEQQHHHQHQEEEEDNNMSNVTNDEITTSETHKKTRTTMLQDKAHNESMSNYPTELDIVNKEMELFEMQ